MHDSLVTLPRDVERRRLCIDGTVQGVGFRPYVFRLASALGLRGFVRNDARSVVVEVEGFGSVLDQFAECLPRDLPPLASCGAITSERIAARADDGFRIVESATAAERADPMAAVAPDAATCDACVAELLDPANRRYRYPFINCTSCGPRFTIVEGAPYDRGRTTMRGFTMCARCAVEYAAPSDRRFHAQPNACASCGPRVRLADAEGRAMRAPIDADDDVAYAAAALRSGAIVAVKGIGGYHLACLARDGDAVDRLRRRKGRPDRPFAIMARDLEAAAELVDLDGRERALIASTARPIVLARRRADAPVADGVAPRHHELGVMLPYSPLHHLLLRDAGAPLVMTSGNRSDEPIAFRDDDALARLAGVADLFLLHDRPIARPVDDSIARVVRLRPAEADRDIQGDATSNGTDRVLVLRRSRGYVPATMPLPAPLAAPAVACGAQLKNTYAFGIGAGAWIGPHLGDLSTVDAYEAFLAGVEADARRLGVRAAQVVHDLHPEYLSSKYAAARADEDDLARRGVQHHHAHFAACLAEHAVSGSAVGVIFDGTGLGDDAQGGGLWGGELLMGDAARSIRAGHLWPVPMPGGERAIREPWRMACAWLCALDPHAEPPRPSALVAHVSAEAWRAVARLCLPGAAGLPASVAPSTTSAGRLLDAVAALCGVAPRVSYEGQAAIELEALADRAHAERYAVPVVRDGATRRLVIDGRALIGAVMSDLERRVGMPIIAARAHNGLAYAVATACRQLGPRTAALAGGVFQNTLLLERTAGHLLDAGFRVCVPERVPLNDGGISYGQLAAAAAQSAETARPRIGTPLH